VIQYLLERDLSRFNPAGLPPMTEWKRVLQGASAHGVEALVRELIEEERTPFDRDLVTVGEITKSWPLLDARRGVLPAALANVGAVHRRVHWKPPGDRARTRGIWILGNHDDYAEMLDAELGNKWLILGGQL